MATRLHLLTLREQYRQRKHRRTNLRLLFVAVFVGVCAFSAGRLSAAELHLVLHGLSAHSGTRTETVTQTVTVPDDQRSKHARPRTRTVTVEREVEVPYQEQNWGAGLRYAFSPAWSVQAGAYRNSYDRTSVYALADWTPIALGPLHAGAFAGVASGYEHGNAAGGLLARVQGERLSAVLRYAPKVHPKQSGHTVALELGWRL